MTTQRPPARPEGAPSPEAVEPSAPDTPRGELVLGGVVSIMFFVVFVGWAAFAPLDAGSYAEGAIAISGNRQAVQHREGGVVTALNVAEGATVQKGQVLLQLSSGDLRAAERGLSSQVYALIAQRARLTAERDGLSDIPVPPEFANLAPGDRSLAAESLRLQRLQFNARRTGRSTDTGVLRQRVAQLNEQVAGYERQMAANAEQQRLVQEELAGMRDLADQGYAPLTRVRALERTAAQLSGENGSLRSQIARVREAIGEARLGMSGVSAKMNEEVAEQLRQVDIRLNELRPQMAEQRAQIVRTEVRAPVSGEVVGLTIFTPGGVVQPGQVLMEIVPRDASQVIVARVNPADIDNLTVGLPTEVRFPGLQERNPPRIRGKVTRISADSFTVEQTGAAYFRVEIVVPASQLETLGSASEALRPGAPVEVMILLRKRSALAYLLEPLTDNLWRASGSGGRSAVR